MKMAPRNGAVPPKCRPFTACWELPLRELRADSFLQADVQSDADAEKVSENFKRYKRLRVIPPIKEATVAKRGNTLV